MKFPRIKEFKFDIEKSYVVPSHFVGRLHKIAFELFGSYKFYKPIASANDIKLTHGLRGGIRPTEIALQNELKQENLSDQEFADAFIEKISVKRINNMDWNNYYDVSYGYLSEVIEGRVLAIPTYNSAVQYLNQFEFLD